MEWSRVVEAAQDGNCHHHHHKEKGLHCFQSPPDHSKEASHPLSQSKSGFHTKNSYHHHQHCEASSRWSVWCCRSFVFIWCTYTVQYPVSTVFLVGLQEMRTHLAAYMDSSEDWHTPQNVRGERKYPRCVGAVVWLLIRFWDLGGIGRRT
jgi:hypothetical protein